MTEISRRFIAGAWRTVAVGAGPSCVLAMEVAMNIHDGGNHAIKWDGLYGNLSYALLPAGIPEGLGIDVATDGSDGTLTVAEEGVWSFGLYPSLSQTDPDWRGIIGEDGAGATSPVIDATWSLPSMTSVAAFSAGKSFEFFVVTLVAAQNNPFNLVAAYLQVVRLS